MWNYKTAQITKAILEKRSGSVFSCSTRNYSSQNCKVL